MKPKTNLAAGIAALAILILAAANLQASVTNVVTITATAIMQGATNYTSAGNIIAAPIKQAMNTKQILSWLAVDAYAKALYPATNFPAGSQLVMIVDRNGDTDFQVLDKKKNFLVDVSEFLMIKRGSEGVFSGKVGPRLGIYSVTGRHIFNFGFDDSSVAGGVGLTFSLTGLETGTITGTNPKFRVYKETFSIRVANLLGEGMFHGKHCFITGTLTLKGSAIL